MQPLCAIKRLIQLLNLSLPTLAHFAAPPMDRPPASLERRFPDVDVSVLQLLLHENGGDVEKTARSVAAIDPTCVGANHTAGSSIR